VLDEMLRAVLTSSQGRVVLLAGEAGVGKTALARAVCAERQGSHRVLRGSCDALFTPRPLGPFSDVAREAGGELERMVELGARPHEVAMALLAELRGAPALLVLEDLHRADEASLDVLSLLAGRLENLPVLVLATYRDDELGPAHPLRIVVGELVTKDAVTRMKLEPLSAAGVERLARSSGADIEDVDDLYRRTSGNPFFVTEVLAAGSGEIPSTVRDAVLARAARLSHDARAALDAAAIVPLGCEYWLLHALAIGASHHLDECLSSGMLVAGPGTVSFRHELARLAVEDALLPAQRVRLHQLALRALGQITSADPTRLAHHAEAANDASAVVRFAPLAAKRAAALGAHREAAQQFARALRFAEHAAPELLAELSDRRAYACYLSGEFPEAVEAQRDALQLHRRDEDWSRVGDAARSLSLLLRYQGDVAQAWDVGREAVTVLEGRRAASHELAMAYCNLSHLAAASENAEETRSWATKAVKVAAQIGDDEARVYAGLNLGSIELLADDPTGTIKIERALHTALERGLEEHAGRGYVALTWWSPRGRSYSAADGHLDAGLRYCDERGLDLWRTYLIAYRARANLDRGHWDDAVASATRIVRDPRTSPVPRIVALAVLGLVRARRGDPDVWTPLDEAWALASETGELQRIEPTAAARAEAWWLAGCPDKVMQATSLALDLASSHRAGWVVGEMASLRRRAGIPVGTIADVPEPFTAELAGEWRRAAMEWRRLDSPYEAALALTEVDHEEAMRQGLAELLQLGARPAAAIVAQRLRRRGARHLPRGPRTATRDNPAHLTTRELDVLALLARGLQNKEIAGELVVSHRTVDHHVAAILRKLGVRTRREAAREATRLGLVVQDQ
jgi:DNA-binding NarL/FixJ family response regulator